MYSYRDMKLQRIAKETTLAISTVVGVIQIILQLEAESSVPGKLYIGSRIPMNAKDLAEEMGLTEEQTWKILRAMDKYGIIVLGDEIRLRFDEIYIGGINGSKAYEDYHPRGGNDITRVLCDATGIIAVPPDQMAYADIIGMMIEHYGEEKTTDALRASFNDWKMRKTRDTKQPYRATNFKWVDFAMAKLASENSSAGPLTDEDINGMTGAEIMAYFAEKKNGK